MLSTLCQSDEDWHAGKLSFIFNVSACEQGFTFERPFPPFPPLLNKRQDIVHGVGQAARPE